jgi:hypothetical protein
VKVDHVSKAQRMVSLWDWAQADPAGVSDCSAILTAAIAQAVSVGYWPVYIPEGRWRLSTSVALNAGVPLIGPAWGRNSNTGAWLDPQMTDGSAALVLSNLAGDDGFHIENIAIRAGGVAGASTARNCTALKLGDPTNTTLTEYAVKRSMLRNVYIYGCAIGLDLKGWINRLYGIHIDGCAVGLRGSYLNDGLLDLVFENCLKDFVLTKSNSTQFLSLSMEGSVGNAASTIDECEEVIIDYLRTEQDTARTVPWISVGATTQVRGFYIDGGTIDNAGAGVAPIALDRVNRYRIRAEFQNNSTSRRTYSTTTNTRRHEVEAPAQTFGYPFVSQASTGVTNNRRDFQRPVENLLPNPFMHGLRFGCYNLTAAASTGGIALSEDTTTYRTGRGSLKVNASTGGQSQRVEFYWNDPWVAVLAEQRITFAAWVWCPNETDIKGEETADSNTIYPAVTVRNAAGTVIGESTSGYALRAGWNFLHCTATIPASATEIRTEVWLNRSSNNTATNDYILVDSMFLCPGDVWEDIYSGRIVQSPMCSGQVVGGNIVLRMTTAAAGTLTADTTQTFADGDTIWYTDPAAAGIPGVVCTTPGAGGTAVFSNMAALA